jgi:hypothetical protein
MKKPSVPKVRKILYVIEAFPPRLAKRRDCEAACACDLLRSKQQKAAADFSTAAFLSLIVMRGYFRLWQTWQRPTLPSLET